MPKDWKCHKAELERLYIKEGKSLQQVREIFREEHGFNASIRAYRMRIDAWGLKKNKSNRGTDYQHQLSPDLSLSAANFVPRSTSTEEESSSQVGQNTSTEHMNAGHPLPSRQAMFEVTSAFENLLTRWQPRAESTLLCFQHPDYDEWVRRSNPDQGPIIFKLIEVLVPQEEQFSLNKSFLEEDLLCHSDSDYPYKSWCSSWTKLLRCEDPEEDEEDYEATYSSDDWEHAKEMLREDEVVSQVAGDRFMGCALVVLAERRLTACRTDAHRWNRRKYLDILKDFRHMEADVDPSFYKDSLQIIELDEIENAQQSKQKRADLADEYRHKYIQLVNRYAYMKKSASQVLTASGDPVSNSSPVITMDQYPSPDTSVSAPRTSEPPELSTNALDIAFPSSPTTQVVFENLASKWKTLNDFTEYAHSIFPNDGWALSIFEPSHTGALNLFDIISTNVPSPERIPFVSALLVAFSSLAPTAFYSPWSLHWWTSVYSAPTWEKFLSRLDAPRTKTHLERIMTPAAAKLFIDSAMLLVGEKLLLGIKTRLVNAKMRRKGLGDPEERARGKKLEAQYMDILREFYAREIKVDQTWTYYLMNIL